MNQQSFSTGWDEDRVRKVLEHYEEQTEEGATAEDEAALEDRGQTLIEVPNELVPEIRSPIVQPQTRA